MSLDALTHLTDLTLSFNPHLTGTIPTTWCMNFINLQTLSLASNSLTGSIPSSLSDCNKLSTIILSDNALTSSLSLSFTSWTLIQTISLDHNHLTGSLSDILCNAWSSTLTTLTLSDNTFTGTLSDSLYSITNLKFLSLENNHFQGTLSDTLLSQWSSINMINLNTNNLEGSIPDSICDLTTLNYLNLAVNNFRNRLPNCWEKLILLHSLYLEENEVEGSLPTSLTYLKRLSYFSAFQNHFTGTLPRSIGNWTTMTQLLLSYNRFSGTIPSEIGYLVNLTTIELNDNMLTGSIPDTIGNCKSLTSLVFSTNQLIGNLPNSIIQLHNLNELQIYNNTLTGSLPMYIGNLSQLSLLSLFDNKLTGTIPSSLFEFCLQLTAVRLDNNYIYGSIPSTIGNTKQMIEINFGTNELTGTIPKEIGQLKHLQQLQLASNHLTGSIPATIGMLHELLILYMYSNDLTGTLPITMTSMKHLVSCLLYDNHLNGTIPSTISNMSSLTELWLYNNQLTGSIPDSIGDCIQLASLIVRNNKLTGSITHSLAKLPFLFYLEFNENYLTGTIPSILFTGTGNQTFPQPLQVLYIADNFFTGTIPVDMYQANQLFQINFGINMLTGIIPVNIGQIEKMNVIYLMANELTGSIPLSLYSLDNMMLLYLFQNQFTGSLSEEIVTFNKLTQLDCHLNYFTGSLPHSLLSLFNLEALYLYDNNFHGNLPLNITGGISILYQLLLNNNMFSGTLANTLNRYPYLGSLNMSQNMLTGSLPDSFKHLRFLQVLDVSYNRLTGALNDKVTESKHLRIFFVENNQFTGKLHDVFNITTQRNLQFVDVSNNQLTGSLSSEFFIAQNMTSYAAVKNCLTGSIPDSICSNRFLQTLALDGLHSADSCRERILPGILTYVLDDVISGTIPTCLFQMEQLQTLHLSGNGIRGSFDNNIPISSSLTDLSLSHNTLSGDIPITIQLHSWLKLDLSFNKFNGDLSGSIEVLTDNQTLTLDVNRLSGNIPNSLMNAKHIDILQGNLFGCSYRHHKNNLPQHDKDNRSYECGSNNIDIPMYLWTGFVTVFAIIVLAVYQLRERHQTITEDGRKLSKLSNTGVLFVARWNQIKQWFIVFSGVSDPSKSDYVEPVNSFGKDLTCIRQLCIVWLGIVVCVLLPLYGGLRVDYSTHKYTYAWSISLAYLGGEIPAIILLIVFIIILLGVEYYVDKLNKFFVMTASRYMPSEEKDENEKDGINKATDDAESGNGSEGDSDSGKATAARTVSSSSDIRRSSAFLANRRSSWSQQDTAIALKRASLGFALSRNTSAKSLSGKLRPASRRGRSSTNVSMMISELSIGSAWLTTEPEIAETNGERGHSAIVTFAETRQKELWNEKLQLTALSLLSITLNVIIVLAVNAVYVYSITLTLGSTQLSIITLAITGFKIFWSALVVAGWICELFQKTLNVYIESAYLTMTVALSELAKEEEIADSQAKSSSSRPTSARLPARKSGKVRQSSMKGDVKTRDRDERDSREDELDEDDDDGGRNTKKWIHKSDMEFNYSRSTRAQTAWTEPSGVSNSTTSTTAMFRMKQKGIESEFLLWVQRYESLASRLLIILSLFNSVIAPCLAVLLVSSTCFYYVITSPSTVNVSYKFVQCEGIYDTLEGFVCVGRAVITHSTSYLPAFSYSYQCSSSILENFVGVYILRYLATGIVIPLTTLMTKQCQIWLVRKLMVTHTTVSSGDISSSESMTSSWLYRCYYVASMLVPPVGRFLDPTSMLSSAQSSDVTSQDGNGATNPLSSLPGQEDVMQREKEQEKERSLLEELSLAMLPADPNQIFVGRRFTTILVGELAIFITFGSIYPPLAIVICFNVLLQMFAAQVALGRFLSLSALPAYAPCVSVLKGYVWVIKRETASIGSLIALSLAPITTLATLFWSFFLYDIYGDEAQNMQALWVVFVLPIVLLVVRLGNIVVGYCKIWWSGVLDEKSAKKKRKKERDHGDVELQTKQ